MSTPELPADPFRLAQRLLDRSERASRIIVGLCGAPGAGKSTLAERLVAELNQHVPGTAVVVGMDGFHLAASVIAADDRASRRGAPDTFDPDGFAALLRRLRAMTDEVVYAPEYRREIEDPVAGALPVPRSCPPKATTCCTLIRAGAGCGPSSTRCGSWRHPRTNCGSPG